MKRRIFGLFILLAVLLAAWGLAQPGCASQAAASCPGDDSEVSHCTVLTLSQGDQVFFGGNHDFFGEIGDPAAATAPTGSIRGAPPATARSILENGTTFSRALTRRGWPTTPTGRPKQR